MMKQPDQQSDVLIKTIVGILEEIKRVNINEFGFAADIRIATLVDEALEQFNDQSRNYVQFVQKS